LTSEHASTAVISPVRTCCIWCADWAVVVVRRRDAATRGRAVVVRERVGSRELVRAASPEARAEGIVTGMSRREAEARCPGLVIGEVDKGEEVRTFEIVARAVEALTPRLELEEPGLLSFPTRGPAVTTAATTDSRRVCARPRAPCSVPTRS